MLHQKLFGLFKFFFPFRWRKNHRVESWRVAADFQQVSFPPKFKVKGHGNKIESSIFCINRFGIGPFNKTVKFLFDFGVEFEEIFVIENRLPVSTRRESLGNFLRWLPVSTVKRIIDSPYRWCRESQTFTFTGLPKPLKGQIGQKNN